MLIAGAVCPHPPLLIPAALGAAGSDPPSELRKVSDATARAVAGLAAARPDLLVVAGGGAAEREYGADAAGGLHGFGVAVTIGAGEPVLPLSLTVGRWLLERGGMLDRSGGTAEGPPVVFQEVARRAAAGDCLKLGRILADRAPRVALLAMGDSCARPAREAPGLPDPVAQDYDEEVAEALAAADARWLARLDPALDEELVVAGRRGRCWPARHGAGVWMGGCCACRRPTVSPTWSPPGRNPGRTDAMPEPVIAVVGPTAAGKSELALELARALGGEVVNADSMQLYAGMDIGTAKLTLAQRGGVPHHLLDIWDVTQTASVAEYQHLARAAIDAIRRRGLVPVLAGGSGLYVRAALDPLEFPGTDPALRARLEAELARSGPAPLYARLTSADPAAAAAILPSNGRRIVRALEVIEVSGRPFSATMPQYESVYPAVQIGLAVDRVELDTRIADRTGRMFAAGLVRGLERAGLREGRTASRALGYAQVLRFLAGDCSEEEARAQTVLATRRFVRRQESWFRRDPRVTWLPAGAADTGDLLGRALATIGPCGSRRGTAPRTTS
jgi:tRNA dimethylallyltransferase